MNEAEDIGEHVQDRFSTGERLLVVVAGPNGAGKSTFVETFLRPTGLRVVNPDQIARALAEVPNTRLLALVSRNPANGRSLKKSLFFFRHRCEHRD